VLAVFEVVGVKCEQGWVMTDAELCSWRVLGFGSGCLLANKDLNPLWPR